MTTLVWEDSYSIGVAAMDKQHQKLFLKIMDLHEAIKEGKVQGLLNETLTGLVIYTQTHFMDEEALMEANGYPGLEAHRLQHAALIRKVDAIMTKYKSGDLYLSQELKELLSEWLNHHICGEDKHYGRFLNERGVF